LAIINRMRLVVERLFTGDFETLFGRIHAKANDEFGTFAIDKMVEATKNPVRLVRMPFGKHKGMKFDEIPTDTLQWLSETDLDEDMDYTVKHHLGITLQT